MRRRARSPFVAWCAIGSEPSSQSSFVIVPVPMPVKRQNPFTGEIETVYQNIRGELDARTLGTIAQTTGGEFLRATDAETLSAVLRRIDALEKTRMTSPKREQIDELYLWPLGAGLALLALALFSGETFWLKVTA